MYFRHSGCQADARRGGAPRRDPGRPGALRPGREPARRRSARDTVLRAMLDQGDITRVEYRRADHDAAARAGATSGCPGIQGPAPYFTNYVKQQLDRRVRHARASSAAACGCGRRSTSGCSSSRARRSRSGCPTTNGPVGGARRHRPARRARARDVRRRGTSRRASSTSRSRASASRARRSSRSCSRRRSSRASRRRRSFVSEPVTISLGDRLWHVENYEGSNLGTIDLETATTYSDNTVYAQLTAARPARRPSRTWRAGSGSRARSRVTSRWPRRRGGESAGDGPGVRVVRQRRAAHRRRADGQRAARRRSSSRQEERTIPVAQGGRSAPNEAAIVTRLLQGVVESGTGKRAQLSDGRPSPARRARRRTTATPGSSATRRSSRSPSGSATRTACGRCSTEYHGDPVAGGTYPGADLQDVHGEGARRASSDGAREVPAAVIPVRVAAARRLPRRALARRQRLLPGHARVLYFYGTRPDDDGELQAERGRGAARGRPDVRRGGGAAGARSR